MLNYLLFVQVLLIIVLFFVYWLTDTIILINFGILYLIILSSMLMYLDSDILISFLVVIDLGVFLILISFSLNLIKYLNSKLIFINIIKNTFLMVSIFTFITLVFFYIFNNNLNINFNNCWFFFINYINYYYTNFIIIISDMVVFKEIYFKINSLEFILISILIIVALLCVYLIITLFSLFINKNKRNINRKLINSTKNDSTFFLKVQNQQNQYSIPASCRVFSKKKYDTKTNSTTNNR